jgi:rhodanese-related sulfurtransferase
MDATVCATALANMGSQGTEPMSAHDSLPDGRPPVEPSHLFALRVWLEKLGDGRAEWRGFNLADRSRPIITTCETGEMAALAGKLLKDMGFTNVLTLKGGTVAWKDAGYPTNAL